MGLYPQPDDWSCGPFALKHALMMLGRFADRRNIEKVAKTHWWAGTDEFGLARAARLYNCRMEMVRRKNADRARRQLIDYLNQGVPVILSVNKTEHWVTAVGHDKNRFFIMDSSTDPAVDVYTWPGLRKWWGYKRRDPEDKEVVSEIFDFHPVAPKFRVQMKAEFTMARVRYLGRKANQDLVENWDEYWDDLMKICIPRSTRHTAAHLSIAELLRRHGEVMVEEVTRWHGEVRETEVRRILGNFRFVAETYALVVPKDEEKRAMTALTVLISFWAAAERGVGEVYGHGG